MLAERAGKPRARPLQALGCEQGACVSGSDLQRTAIVLCLVGLLRFGGGGKNFHFLCFGKCVLSMISTETSPEYPSVSFYLELSSNQEDATTAEQPEVIPLTDDQGEKESGKGRTALKLTIKTESFFGFLPRIHCQSHRYIVAVW